MTPRIVAIKRPPPVYDVYINSVGFQNQSNFGTLDGRIDANHEYIASQHLNAYKLRLNNTYPTHTALCSHRSNRNDDQTELSFPTLNQTDAPPRAAEHVLNSAALSRNRLISYG